MPRVVTWNMQGAKASDEVKWQTGVANFLGDGADIVCLQECGAQPASAVLQPGNLAGNANYHLYFWGSERTRKYISHYHWDVGGNRCNLAIVTKVAPTAWFCQVPAGGPVWRPIIGVQVGGVWYCCLHAISPGGADAAGLLAAGAAAAGGGPWFTGGDFNREPAPPLPTGFVCPPNGNTYPSTAPVSKYDYAYSSVRTIVGTVQALYLSDHLATSFTT